MRTSRETSHGPERKRARPTDRCRSCPLARPSHAPRTCGGPDTEEERAGGTLGPRPGCVPAHAPAGRHAHCRQTERPRSRPFRAAPPTDLRHGPRPPGSGTLALRGSSRTPLAPVNGDREPLATHRRWGAGLLEVLSGAVRTTSRSGARGLRAKSAARTEHARARLRGPSRPVGPRRGCAGGAGRGGASTPALRADGQISVFSLWDGAKSPRRTQTTSSPAGSRAPPLAGRAACFLSCAMREAWLSGRGRPLPR